MKTWYKGICDVCGVGIDLFVSNPSCTAHYLAEHDAEIQKWLEDHHYCGKGIRLVDLNGPFGDEIYGAGWSGDINSPLGEIVRLIDPPDLPERYAYIHELEEKRKTLRS